MHIMFTAFMPRGVYNLPYKEEGKQCFLLLVRLYKLYTPPLGKYRVPEPVRQADMMSREEIRLYNETGQKRSRGGVIHN